jgi:hypothetical protein
MGGPLFFCAETFVQVATGAARFGHSAREMLEVLCELCLATHRFAGDPPEGCPNCGAPDSLVGPYSTEARITGRQPADYIPVAIDPAWLGQSGSA